MPCGAARVIYMLKKNIYTKGIESVKEGQNAIRFAVIIVCDSWQLCSA